jgi:beta-aspartyl-peptidase (threonine type)
MERSEHLFIVGAGAGQFARECGFKECKTTDLLVGAERERYDRIRAGEEQLVRQEFHPDGHGNGPLGTVGAVARDNQGDLVAATSTGGTQDKRVGRVGDTPILGAGSWAENALGAASATGWGEGILRSLMTFRAVQRLGEDLDAIRAAQFGISQLEKVGGRGGLIVLNRQGNPGHAYNTPRMARGWLDTNGEIRVAVDERVFGEQELS